MGVRSANYRLINAAFAAFKDLRWDQRARIVTWFTAGQSVPDALARIGLKHVWDGDAESKEEYFESHRAESVEF